jgi:hypothetical protein
MSPKAPAGPTPEPAPGSEPAAPAAPSASTAPAPAPAPTSAPTAPPASAPTAPAAPAAPPAPADPAARRRLLLILGIAGGAVILVIVAIIVVVSLIASSRSPKAAVSAYLDQLVAGRVDQALLRVDGASDSPFLSDAVYSKADNRVTRYEVTDSRESGSTAQVTVDITTRSGGWTDVLQLVQVDGEWRIDGRTLPTVDLTWMAPDGFGLAVNGVELDADTISGQHTFAVLPGAYDITQSARSDAFELVPQTLDIPSFVQSGAPEQLDVPVTLTDDGEAAANRALRSFLDNCARQNTPKPKGHCGFAVNTGGKKYTTNKWTITSRPTADFAAFDGTGWEVITTKPGIIKYKGTNSSYIGTATIKGYEYVGYITFDGKVATFTSEYEE